VLVIFEIGSHFIPELACTWLLLFVLHHLAGMLGMCHHTQPLVVMGSHDLLPQTEILPIPASHGGVSHHAGLNFTLDWAVVDFLSQLH
jgi:hypothetical protein